jgi:glycopeptide antibiotics resistance protein
MASDHNYTSLQANETTPLFADENPAPDDLHQGQGPIADATFLSSIKSILASNPTNVLLVFLPFALLSGFLEWSPRVIFFTNVFAMMPLASLLSFTTDCLSRWTGDAIGGFLNVTFGNVMELIIGIVALRNGEVALIQTTMLGSILSNLLFVHSLSFRPLMWARSSELASWLGA